MRNDGSGRLVVERTVFSGPNSLGPLGLAVADLNGDGKLDVVQNQGEVTSADLVFWGVDIAPDTAAPIISAVESVVDTPDNQLVRARVHDNKTPLMPHDLRTVVLRTTRDDDPSPTELAMSWYGGTLWSASVDAGNPGVIEYQVCAEDAVGNATCSDVQSMTVIHTPSDADAGADAAGPSATGPTDGCGCRAGGAPGGRGRPVWMLTLVLLALVTVRRLERSFNRSVLAPG